MKTMFCTVSIVLAFIGFQMKAFAAGDTLVILHMNDTHSNILPIGPKDVPLKGTLGGAARVATLIKQTQLQSTNVLTLHAGDSFIGDPVFNGTAGAGELAVLLSMGVDAMAVGNHEFDLGPALLKQALDTAFQQAQVPLLSANLILDAPEAQPLKQYIQPYLIKQYGAMTVGIFGLLTPSTNLLSRPFPAFVDTLVLETAAAMVDTLQSRGCDLIICLSHLGVGIDQAVAAYVPGIHIIVGGHDHIKFDEPIAVPNVAGDTTFIVQTDGFYLNIGKITVVKESDNVRIAGYTMIPVNTTVNEDADIAALVEMLKSAIEAAFGPLYSQQIGYAAETFEEVSPDPSSNGPKDTPIGNLVTNAFREMFKTDIAIEAGGSTAQPLYKGPIVAADLFRVVGYGFNEYNYLGYRMATFMMTGAAIVQGLETGLEYCMSEMNDEFLIQASGLTYRYNPSRSVGERCEEVIVNGEPIDPAKEYSVASGEFTPMFMTTLEIPFSNLVIYNDSTEFQTLVAYVTQRDTIYPQRRNSVVSPVKEREPSSDPTEFRLEQNYPNPFNPSTTIRYEVPVTGTVCLTIYDMLGRTVATLTDEVHSPGVKEIQWIAGSIASGIYFYKLESGKYRSVKKMILIR
ncbi:MAG: 5'-nucleotidase C-terminal domain-containing protein [Ignavibacteriales bacterium]|nr:5'-nucleotidase C-terminal domain-containing protein [Ignavibacteriales bacterium]